jgi:hypothetical protein
MRQLCHYFDLSLCVAAIVRTFVRFHYLELHGNVCISIVRQFVSIVLLLILRYRRVFVDDLNSLSVVVERTLRYESDPNTTTATVGVNQLCRMLRAAVSGMPP